MTSATLRQITEQAMMLPLEQRAELAQKLWESIDGGAPMPRDLECEVLTVAKRRAEELESGKDPGVTHQDVMEAAKKAIECE